MFHLVDRRTTVPVSSRPYCLRSSGVRTLAGVSGVRSSSSSYRAMSVCPWGGAVGVGLGGSLSAVVKPDAASAGRVFCAGSVGPGGAWPPPSARDLISSIQRLAEPFVRLGSLAPSPAPIFLNRVLCASVAGLSGSRILGPCCSPSAILGDLSVVWAFATSSWWWWWGGRS